MSIFKDKYFILSVSAILIFTLFWTMDDDIEERDLKGIVFDVRESRNGFTFSVETPDGEIRKCFFRECPEIFKPYLIKGNLSDDGTILFVEKMIILEY